MCCHVAWWCGPQDWPLATSPGRWMWTRMPGVRSVTTVARNESGMGGWKDGGQLGGGGGGGKEEVGVVLQHYEIWRVANLLMWWIFCIYNLDQTIWTSEVSRHHHSECVSCLPYSQITDDVQWNTSHSQAYSGEELSTAHFHLRTVTCKHDTVCPAWAWREHFDLCVNVSVICVPMKCLKGNRNTEPSVDVPGLAKMILKSRMIDSSEPVDIPVCVPCVVCVHVCAMQCHLLLGLFSTVKVISTPPLVCLLISLLWAMRKLHCYRGIQCIRNALLFSIAVIIVVKIIMTVIISASEMHYCLVLLWLLLW